MRSQEELRQILGEQPDCFEALCEMSAWYYHAKNYAGCFAMLERAIASYEANPIELEQSKFFEIKRLNASMQRNFLPEILGVSYELLDLRRMPIFKLGRVREMTWRFNASNYHHIAEALISPQLRRLRYLTMTFESGTDFVLQQLSDRLPESLRAINLYFDEMPDRNVFLSFWHNYQQSCGLSGIVSITMRMPFMDDEMACAVRDALDKLECLHFTSQDPSGITPIFCEKLADDPRSNMLLRLGLVGTSIGDEGLFTLLSSENFEAVQTLDVHDGILTNATARVLHAEHNMNHLRNIDLSYNRIDPAGLAMLQNTSLQIKTEGQHQRPE